MLLAIDFDGTLCEQDTVDWFSAHWAPGVFAEADRRLMAGEIDLDTCLQLQVAPITQSEDEVVAFLVETIRVRPGAHELVAFCAERGIEPVIVSSGFENLMRPILAANGLDLPISAHAVDCGPGGMRVRFRGRAHCDLCGTACKRAEVRALAAGRPIAYVGDGISDLCAAEDADLRFARHTLARHLAAEGHPFTPFEDMHDVRRGLAAALDGAA